MERTPEQLEKLKQYQYECNAILHGIQTGIAQLMGMGKANDTTPKHLRVGLNNALVEHGALVRLLIEKRIIDEWEYFEMYKKMLIEERTRYEEEISSYLGAKITLA